MSESTFTDKEMDAIAELIIENAWRGMVLTPELANKLIKKSYAYRNKNNPQRIHINNRGVEAFFNRSM
jgi:ribosomal protein L13